ncbi:hypothetical protein Cob_v000290 [Colletotrichum orbiculare MAFF 240422]|uniref:Uncharacterized protein n=1 Tax=Colletotrichum orbiculare (strain 104-T / ATCC 96160 / CBS 514.97 / LARS 414 / MAFF 240422) TaxID=1213857 RepID=A0A484G8W5_COLOR|nr:hypothetical protein Cob_v000290 [Colletotrichum orbiculare MAFF 240422]
MAVRTSLEARSFGNPLAGKFCPRSPEMGSKCRKGQQRERAQRNPVAYFQPASQPALQNLRSIAPEGGGGGEQKVPKSCNHFGKWIIKATANLPTRVGFFPPAHRDDAEQGPSHLTGVRRTRRAGCRPLLMSRRLPWWHVMIPDPSLSRTSLPVELRVPAQVITAEHARGKESLAASTSRAGETDGKQGFFLWVLDFDVFVSLSSSAVRGGGEGEKKPRRAGPIQQSNAGLLSPTPFGVNRRRSIVPLAGGMLQRRLRTTEPRPDASFDAHVGMRLPTAAPPPDVCQHLLSGLVAQQQSPFDGVRRLAMAELALLGGEGVGDHPYIGGRRQWRTFMSMAFTGNASFSPEMISRCSYGTRIFKAACVEAGNGNLLQISAAANADRGPHESILSTADSKSKRRIEKPDGTTGTRAAANDCDEPEPFAGWGWASTTGWPNCVIGTEGTQETRGTYLLSMDFVPSRRLAVSRHHFIFHFHVPFGKGILFAPSRSFERHPFAVVG